MAILDLDKTILRKTIIGITCSACGGNLKRMEKKTLTEKAISAVTFGKINIQQYECDNCKKHFLLV